LPGDKSALITSRVQDIILKPVHAGDLIGALADCRPLRVTQAGQPAGRSYEGVALTQLAVSDTSVQNNGELPPIDPAFLSQFDSLTGGEVAPLLAQLVDYFTSNAARLLVKMQRAIDSQDPGAILQQAEALRASSANIGARRMAELCAEAGKTITIRGQSGVQEQMSRILTEYNRVRAQLEQLTKNAAH
jgi:HPt (histidine-containing phosphotransfer) domain-containing protein